MASLIVGTIYYGLMFILAGFFLLLALIFPKKAKGFFIAAGCIVVLFVIVIPLWARLSLKIMEIKERPVKEAAEKRYNEARAVFDEQCKKAGEKIYRTVDNVDRVMLLNLMGENERKIYDPMWEDAAINLVLLSPYTAERYIETFLSYDIDYNVPEQKYHSWTNGYQFVDVLEKGNNMNTSSITRYTRLTPAKDSVLQTEFQPVNPARYIVILEKNVDSELRKHWVAGATIKIIDRQTDELLAEKTIFAFDPLQGATSDRGAPWSRADICQEMDEIKRQGTYVFISPISNFVFTVLTPKLPYMETQNE